MHSVGLHFVTYSKPIQGWHIYIIRVHLSLQRSRDKIFSFVPPDGKFILAEYRYSPNLSSSSATVRISAAASSAGTSMAKDNVPILFSLKTKFDLSEYNASFDITLTSRLTTRVLENVVVQLDLGEGASSIKCTAARGTGGLGRGGAMDVGIGGSSGASWTFNIRKRVLKWEIPSMAHWSLRGSFTTPTIAPRPSHAFQIYFPFPGNGGIDNVRGGVFVFLPHSESSGTSIPTSGNWSISLTLVS